MGFIAGRYTGTWNSLNVGQVADGYRLSLTAYFRPITGDGGGDVEQDAIYRGNGIEVAFTIIEYDAAAVSTLIWPGGGSLYSLGTIGQLAVASSMAKSLVLTRFSANTTATPASLTLPLTLLKDRATVQLLMASDLKEVPIALKVFPNGSGVYGTQS